MLEPDDSTESELLFLRKVASLAPLVFIMGGFAEDVLLDGRLGRTHHDLDLLVRRSELGLLLDALSQAGLGEFTLSLADAMGRPMLFGGRAGRLELEVYVATPEPSGGYSFEVPGQASGSRLRLFLPADTFSYPATMFAGVLIQTVSPLALCLLRAASAETRHNGEKRARDLAMRTRLRQVFLAGCDDEQLRPRIEAV